MPPKTSPPKAAKASKAPEGFTPERFERELKDLAAKAKSDTWQNRSLDQALIYTKSFILIGLLGVYSHVSQLALSPVFGTIPSSLHHSRVVILGCFIGWAANVALRQNLPVKTAQLLPLVAVYIPVIQFFMYSYSTQLGGQWGPVVTEGLTLLPLAVLSASCVADLMDQAEMTAFPHYVADALPGIGSWGVFKLAEHLAQQHISAHVGTTFLYTRLGLEILLSAAYTVFAPSKLLVLTIPALLHTAVWNTHVPTPMALSALNETLIADKWMILDRRESITGYISVLENLDAGFRVLRCDSSLLGGEWVRYRGKASTEPIYGVFAMLEAVRLVEVEKRVEDKDANALVIGLGIGTTPSALVTHGIKTTVVEIDPVVHEFAAKYFELKENSEPVLQDAVSYTRQLVEEASGSYDYIVHDVFTGGAEPVDLFTLEFLQGLSSLLKPEGVIAINYAGDFQLPAPQLIARTIKEVFPTCRVFRESPPDPKFIEEHGSDFTNLIFFCRKTTKPLTFREPVNADFLESRTRQVFLYPKNEVPVAELFPQEQTGVLRSNETNVLTKWHKESAMGHWNIMRVVAPAKVWEQW
ncbi:spermine spermidine synthase family [Paramyrothecium foliicola]|nr:spermine spermidine synthase family [Paramyrothecium foliicola]